MFVACCDTAAIQYRLNFSPENQRLILVDQARLQPSASVLWWLCYFRGERGEKSALCSPFEGSCHAGPVYSVWHCSRFFWQIAVIESPHTRSLFHECLSYLFKDTLVLFFLLLDLLFSVNCRVFAYFYFDFCVHQIIFVYDKLLFEFALKCATLQRRVYLLTDSKAQVTLLKMWWKLSHCVTKVTKLQGVLSSYWICIQRCTFFVLPSQLFIYRAKCCYRSWMLTSCHWSHDFLAESCLLFPLHRKLLEMFTSRALCTEPWRQTLVMVFDLFITLFELI